MTDNLLLISCCYLRTSKPCFNATLVTGACKFVPQAPRGVNSKLNEQDCACVGKACGVAFHNNHAEAAHVTHVSNASHRHRHSTHASATNKATSCKARSRSLALPLSLSPKTLASRHRFIPYTLMDLQYPMSVAASLMMKSNATPGS